MTDLQIIQIFHDYVCMEGGWQLFLQYVEDRYGAEKASQLDNSLDELLDY